MDSVTFNPIITNDSNCITDTSVPWRKHITCPSSDDSNYGATYKLAFKIETVPYNKYQEAWETSVDIIASNPKFGTQYLIRNATNSINTEYSEDTKDKIFTFTHGGE